MRFFSFLFIGFIISACNGPLKPEPFIQDTSGIQNEEVHWTDFDSVRLELFGRNVMVTVFETTDSLTACQRERLDSALAMNGMLYAEIKDSIFKWYKGGYELMREGVALSGYPMSEEQVAEFLPPPSTAEALTAYYYPTTIYLPTGSSCNDPVFGIEFECTWDMEHGQGILIGNGKVKRTGFAEAAWPE
jgi:hypothetical protein